MLFFLASRNAKKGVLTTHWSDPKRPNTKFGPYQTVLYVAPFAPYGANNASLVEPNLGSTRLAFDQIPNPKLTSAQNDEKMNEKVSYVHKILF